MSVSDRAPGPIFFSSLADSHKARSLQTEHPDQSVRELRPAFTYHSSHWDVWLQNAHRQRESCRIGLCEDQQFTSASCVTKESHFFYHHRKTCMEDNGFRPVSFRVKVFHFRWLLHSEAATKCKRNRLGDQDQLKGFRGNSTVCTEVSGRTSTLHYFFLD